jgi:hypothetical protein
MLTSSSPSISSSPNLSSQPNSLLTLTPLAAATGVVLAFALVLAFFAASSSAFPFSPSMSSLVSATIFLALFLEAGVAVAVAAVAFLFGVLGCGVVLVLLSWMVEERAPYL